MASSEYVIQLDDDVSPMAIRCVRSSCMPHHDHDHDRLPGAGLAGVVWQRDAQLSLVCAYSSLQYRSLIEYTKREFLMMM